MLNDILSSQKFNKCQIYTKDDFSHISEVISFLGFPLAFGVVLMHVLLVIDNSSITNSQKAGFLVYTWLTKSLSITLCKGIVPTFFFISGYLFFRNLESFSLCEYKVKVSLRVKS